MVFPKRSEKRAIYAYLLKEGVLVVKKVTNPSPTPN